MAACQILGHADSYGLGIRMAFYLQWFGLIITCWLLESDALSFKFLNSLTILATAIGLALNLDLLQPAEIYIILLLVCGTLYFLVPVYLWRLLTCCRPWWDTERWNRMRMGWLFRACMALLFGTLLGIQIWFWCTGVYVRPTVADTNCQQYGFFFGQMVLDGPALTAINIILHIAMLLMGIWLFCVWIGMFDDCRWWRRRKKQRWSITQERINSLQRFRTLFDLIVASIGTMAIELVISWNNISGVNNLDSAAQLIPLIISGAFLIRSIYVWMFGPSPPQDHYNLDFPFFSTSEDGRGGSSYTYDVSDSKPKRRRHSYHHHRRQRRNTHMGYDTGEPVMSTAYSRRATVVDVPEEEGLPAEQVPVVPEPVHENA
ncbi:unnamed protein product [Discula destructiva]